MAAFAELDNELRAEMVRRGRRQAFHRGINTGNILSLPKMPSRQEEVVWPT
jgi:DNA invertase Pin-like site-specific DNA recombinase